MKHPFAHIILFISMLLVPITGWSIGLMIPTNSDFQPFDLVSHRAKVTITNNAALTTVTQVFKNNTDRLLEAQFVFPIPKGGTVSNFSLWINGKKTKGAVLEKKEARKIYESIVRRMQDPGLVEYMDGKLFRTSIFPIPPQGTQKLEIQFGQVLEKHGDMYRYIYPLAAGKNYVTATTSEDFTITGTINSAIPLKNIYSPSHKIGITRSSDKKAIFGAESLNQKLDRDFQLYISHSKKDIGISLMTHDPDGKGGEDGYFMMAMSPKVESAAHEEIGQSLSFIIDTSGSMDGDKIRQARETLAYCISKLRPQDHFNIIRFSTDVETLYSNPVKATKNNKKEALIFVKNMVASGGTAISDALELTLKQKTQKYQPHQILFITDGNPTVGLTEIKPIIEKVKTHTKTNTRIFSFGVGFSLNTTLLDSISRTTRGQATYVEPDVIEIQAVVAALYDRISTPVMTNIKINFGKTKVYDLYPRPIPDLFRGDQIVIFGRYKKAFKSSIVVKGSVGKSTKKYTFSAAHKTIAMNKESAAPLEFIPKLWATRKVGFLLENIRIHGNSNELKTEVIRLGKKFGLVTPFTSYLAVDDSEINAPELSGISGISGIRNRDLKSGGLGRGSKKSKKRNKRKINSTSDSFEGFDAASGKDAVKSSVKTRALKESLTVEESEEHQIRYVAARTFVWEQGIWIQENISKKKAKKIKAYSKAFFMLLKKHPELKISISKLGHQLKIKLGKKVYLIH